MIALPALRLPPTLGDTLIAEARAAGDAEVCGFVAAGPRHRVRYRIANRAARAADRFDMDAADQIAAFKRMRKANARLLAIYHSHPAGEAEPSIHDIRGHSYPAAAALIVAPAAGHSARIRAWRMTDDEPLEITIHWAETPWCDGFL